MYSKFWDFFESGYIAYIQLQQKTFTKSKRLCFYRCLKMLEELMALQDTETFLWKAKEQVVTI